ncbi:MAG TPA: hypothetical protein VF532_02075 [Candidatus Angelobacter sp.]
MVCPKLLVSSFAFCIFAGGLSAQPKTVPSQSPRQALVEMFSGSEEKVRKHLTLEVQNKLAELMRDYPAGTDPLRALTQAGAQGTQKFDAFDLGPILFALNDSAHHTRMEAHIDSDELAGEEDNISISLHSYRNGVEQEMPLGVGLLLNLKLQEGTWRLNAVTFRAKIPLGDPRILDQSWLNPQVLGLATLSSLPAGAGNAATPVPQAPMMTPLRAVRLISLAETAYALQHPDQGYTCGIGNLVNVGKGMDDGAVYKFMDPEFAAGVYNGYRFVLSGCQGNPVRSFQVAAEPLTGRGKAYCSDDRRNLRTSDDGKASTCLAQGKMARQ